MSAAMIIWGSKGVTKTVDSGMFHCPRCQVQQDYKHQKASRYFTLYFIPIFETEQLGEFIECNSCRAQFVMAVLDNDPKKIEAKWAESFDRLALHLMLVMVSVDGIAPPADLETVRATFKRMTGRELSDAQVRSALSHPDTSPSAVVRAASDVGQNLNERGKETLMQVALHVAGPVREIGARNRKVLSDVGQAIGMTQAHFRGVLAEFDYARQ
jgi:hypothetical protein